MRFEISNRTVLAKFLNTAEVKVESKLYMFIIGQAKSNQVKFIKVSPTIRGTHYTSTYIVASPY